MQAQGILDQYAAAIISGGANSRLLSSRAQPVYGLRSDSGAILDGKPTVRTIGASWTGDHDHPKADTSVPVLVYDQRYEQPQSLQAEEAELLMGFPAGSTSGHAVPQIERLGALGDSWDVRTSLMLNRFSRHAIIRVDGPLSVNSPSLQSSGNSAKQALLAARSKSTHQSPPKRQQPDFGPLGFAPPRVAIPRLA